MKQKPATRLAVTRQRRRADWRRTAGATGGGDPRPPWTLAPGRRKPKSQAAQLKTLAVSACVPCARTVARVDCVRAHTWSVCETPGVEPSNVLDLRRSCGAPLCGVVWRAGWTSATTRQESRVLGLSGGSGKRVGYRMWGHVSSRRRSRPPLLRAKLRLVVISKLAGLRRQTVVDAKARRNDLCASLQAWRR